MSTAEFESQYVAGTLALAELTIVAFPAVVTVNAVLGGVLSLPQVAAASLVVALPATVEFVFSRRNLSHLGRYIAAVAVLWPVSNLFAALASAAAGSTRPIAAVQLAFVAGGYLLAYALVYRGWFERVRDRLR